MLLQATRRRSAGAATPRRLRPGRQEPPERRAVRRLVQQVQDTRAGIVGGVQIAPVGAIHRRGVGHRRAVVEQRHARPEELDHIDRVLHIERGAEQFRLAAGKHVAAELRPILQPARQRLRRLQGEQILAQPVRQVGGVLLSRRVGRQQQPLAQQQQPARHHQPVGAFPERGRQLALLQGDGQLGRSNDHLRLTSFR